MIKKVRVIGDIHGRTNWQQLVEPFNEETMYVFVGDYTDPYSEDEDVTYEQMIDQLNKVFTFKREHSDNVILLYGNHDIQYITGIIETRRYDRVHVKEIEKLLADNEELFYGIAYCVGEKYLISHAGVTYDWYTHRCKFDKYRLGREHLSEVCANINHLWNQPSEAGYNKEMFTFGANATRFSDHYGNDTNHSPLWVRSFYLWGGNLLGFGSGKIQVVGHTPYEDLKRETQLQTTGRIATIGTLKTPATIEEIERGYYILDGMNKCRTVENDPEHVDIIIVDCLHRETACIEIDTETMEWKKIHIEDVIKIETK